MHLAISIFAIIFLSLLHSLHSIQHKSPLMTSSNYVTKSGNISVNTDSGGYYFNVDLAYHPNDASEDENFDTSMVRMTLALYTSQTMLASNYGGCLQYDTYDCTKYQCTPYTSNSSTPVFPNFEVSTGYYVQTQLYLDYSYWQLNTNATLASSCFTNISYYFGQGRYGILGLGRNGTEANFLKDNPTFSIYLDPYNDQSILLFSENTNITMISSLVGSLQTNADWNILPSPIDISFSNYEDTLTLGVIFDLNSVGIGVPLSLYNTIIQTLESTGSVNCDNSSSTSTSSPNCYWYRSNNNSQDFPTLKLTIQGQEIDIPSDMYASGNFEGTGTGNVKFVLNFRALDPSMKDNSYVTSAYQNYIIFDKSFMSYYYTEFTHIENNYTVTLYKPNFEISSPSSPPFWPWILGGVFGFLVIVVLIGIWVRRRRNNKVKDKIQRDKKSENESREGLMANDSSQIEGYRKRDFTTYQYGQESWISPDVPQSS